MKDALVDLAKRDLAEISTAATGAARKRVETPLRGVEVCNVRVNAGDVTVGDLSRDLPAGWEFRISPPTWAARVVASGFPRREDLAYDSAVRYF